MCSFMESPIRVSIGFPAPSYKNLWKALIQQILPEIFTRFTTSTK